MEHAIELGYTADSPDHRLIRVYTPLSENVVAGIHNINAPEKMGTDHKIRGLRGVLYVTQMDQEDRPCTEIDVWTSTSEDRNADQIALKVAQAIKKMLTLEKDEIRRQKGQLPEEGTNKYGIKIDEEVKDWTDRTPGKPVKSEEESVVDNVIC